MNVGIGFIAEEFNGEKVLFFGFESRKELEHSESVRLDMQLLSSLSQSSSTITSSSLRAWNFDRHCLLRCVSSIILSSLKSIVQNV